MILPILSAAILYGIYRLFASFLRPTKAHTLPGPDHNPSWFFGHNKVEWARPDGGLHLEWVRDYGHVFSSQGFLAVSFRVFDIVKQGTYVRCTGLPNIHNRFSCPGSCLEQAGDLREAPCHRINLDSYSWSWTRVHSR
jgi:hypothetical protein